MADLFKQGVIDPARVVRTALQDAATVAGLGGGEAEPEAAPAMPHGGIAR
jgi:chaperonin GroEL